MKVLAKGPRFNNIQLCCRYCESRLLVEQDDVNYRPSEGDGPYESPGFFWAKCGHCGEQIILDEKYIPHKMRKDMRGW